MNGSVAGVSKVHALALASGEHRALVLVLAYTRLRWGEGMGLRVKDVDVERRRISISVNAVEVGREIQVGTPKTHARRAVPSPRLLESVQRMLGHASAAMTLDICADLLDDDLNAVSDRLDEAYERSSVANHGSRPPQTER